MAADGGNMIWGGRPLTEWEKRIAGSFKMAADGGSMIWGGRPLTEVGKSRAQLDQRKKNDSNDLTRFLMILSLDTTLCYIKANVLQGNLWYFSRGGGTAPIGIPRGGFPSGIDG